MLSNSGFSRYAPQVAPTTAQPERVRSLLDVIRDLMRAAPRLLDPEGPRAIWMEVDTSHPPLIEEWLKEDEQAALQLEQVSQMDDLYGRPRFVEVRWSGA